MSSKPWSVPTPLENFKPGDWFANRIELSLSGLHRPRRAGIGGTIRNGSDSIVLSGVYEDDVDLGDVVWYVGHGGRDAKTGRQIADQTLDRYNLALMRSYETGRPLRLIRGATLQNQFAPETGYRYEGLYRVVEAERIVGKSGFRVWMFRLVQLAP
ncbi:YDG/SRA domain-containing protein [Spirosoma soli]|uniref:YDG/SRA domain-containing protein n=1 Tax=Spirosoma soli TaxID=1770529 RepID=A0ABW5MBU8_9BACT